MKAYRIANWWRYEVIKNGGKAVKKTKMGSLRIKPLEYVRFDVNADKSHNHILSADYRRMVDEAGPELAAACDGVYKALVGLAGNQVRDYRGWVLDDWQQPMDSGQIAKFLCLSKEKISQILEILSGNVVKLIEFLEFPESLHKSLSGSDLSGVSQNNKSGNNQEKLGSPLYETETERERETDTIVSETEEGVLGENWDREGNGRGENAGQPQARPPASVSASDTDSVTDSVSEKPTDSASDSAPVSDSVSKPGAGPGADGSGLVSEQQRFEIIRECKKAALDLSQIIHPHNQSDITTINDIFWQLQQRMIAGSPYPLFEMSLNTARQCWRGNKPIAVFVAAMKKPPFYYVPKKLNIIPCKFSRDKNINKNSSERRNQ